MEMDNEQKTATFKNPFLLHIFQLQLKQVYNMCSFFSGYTSKHTLLYAALVVPIQTKLKL